MNKTPEYMFVGFMIEAVSPFDIVQWAKETDLSNYKDVDFDLAEIAYTNVHNDNEVNQVVECLHSYIAKTNIDFDIASAESEKFAQLHFKEKLNFYLNSDGQPWSVCKMIQNIENFYDFPDWLGNMYNACDWCEPDSSRSDFDYLEEEILTTLNGLLKDIN